MAADSRMYRTPARVSGITPFGLEEKEGLEARWAIPATPVFSLLDLCWNLKELEHTFYSFMKGALLGHVGNCSDLDSAGAEFLLPHCT